MKKPGSRKHILFLKSFGRHLCTAATYAFLFLLLFAGILYLLLKNGLPDKPANANAPVPVVIAAPSIPEFREIVGIFERHETVTKALAKQGLSSSLIGEIIDCARPVYNLAKVKAGEHYWLCFTSNGNFRNFRYPVDGERYLTVYHDVAQDRLVPVLKKFSYENRVEAVSATIDSSLFASIQSIGEQDQLALDLAEIFGSDIDFYTDIQKGDWFKVLVEKKYLNGQVAAYGTILAAAFNNKQKLFTGFRFEDEKGKPAYYAADGRSLRRSFLKSPLKFARISSRFSLARMHPILRVLRPHLGVDYAAHLGTPVQAVGDGVVTGAGYSGGNGKMVRIRHSGGYETMYLHLSRIAIKSGVRVNQGRVIGYVGSTGLSTGPHLDFRVLRNGRAVNPLKVISPPGNPVPRALFDKFAALRDKLNDELRMTKDELAQAP